MPTQDRERERENLHSVLASTSIPTSAPQHRTVIMQRTGLLRCAQLIWLTSRSASSFLNPTPLSNKRGFSTAMSANSVNLGFGTSLESAGKYDSTLVIGKPASMQDVLPTLLESIGLKNLDSSIFNAMITEIDSKKGGQSTTMIKLDDDTSTHKIIFGALPSNVSRNNHPMSVHSITKLAGSASGNSRILVLTDDFPIGPLAGSIAKAFPLFSMKSNKSEDKNVDVAFCKSDGSFVDDSEQLKAAQSVATGVQLAARLMDSHPELLTTTQFAEEVESLVSKNQKVSFTQLVGEELKPYGGLYGVGKAAVCPPRLVMLEYDGGGDETVALVGKGIIYDTGGLSLKPKTGKYESNSIQRNTVEPDASDNLKYHRGNHRIAILMEIVLVLN